MQQKVSVQGSLEKVERDKGIDHGAVLAHGVTMDTTRGLRARGMVVHAAGKGRPTRDWSKARPNEDLQQGVQPGLWELLRPRDWNGSAPWRERRQWPACGREGARGCARFHRGGGSGARRISLHVGGVRLR